MAVFEEVASVGTTFRRPLSSGVPYIRLSEPSKAGANGSGTFRVMARVAKDTKADPQLSFRCQIITFVRS